MSILKKLGGMLLKNADKICIIAGVTGVGIGVTVACKDTLKGTDDICEAKAAALEKDYKTTAKKMAKVYWPSAVIIGGSLFLIVNGHCIIKKRYAGLVVAYSSLNQQYKSYRGYISENYGEKADFDARHTINGLKYETVEANVDVPIIEADDIFIPDRDLSDFAVFFGKDYSELLASDDPEEAYNVVRAIEEVANAKFHEQGYIFLQDIYDMLGIDKFAPDGVGWCEGIGDNYVDFGIYNFRNGRAVNNLEPVFLLDFNHDGYILPYI